MRSVWLRRTYLGLGSAIWALRIVPVPATSAARLGAGAECLVDDGLDGAGAATAFGAATKAAIKLLRISRQGNAGAHGIANVVVAEDVTRTNDHYGRRVRLVMLTQTRLASLKSFVSSLRTAKAGNRNGCAM